MANLCAYLLLTIAAITLSLYPWYLGHIALKVKRGELSFEEATDLFGGKNVKWMSGQDKFGLAPYLNLISGFLIILLFMVLLIVDWYRNGLSQVTVIGGIGVFIWLVIVIRLSRSR